VADIEIGRIRARPRRFRLDSGAGNVLWALAAAALVIALWSATIAILRPPSYILPAPWTVIEKTWVDRGLLASNGVTTMIEIIVGLVISIVIAIPLGIAVVAIQPVRKIVYPIIVAFNAIPKVALAPLFVVWLGYGYLPRILITASIAFFPILVSTVGGLMSLEPDFLRLARVLQARESQLFLRMRLPNALPAIFSGIKVATSLAVIGAIIGEFVASDSGWGYLLVQASGTLDTAIMFSVVIILALVATALFGVVALSERLMVSWHASQRR
jgi:NitT/TauT family transport system permease protein